MSTCNLSSPSLADPTHVHTCTGHHDAGDHFCGKCRRWWYAKDATPKIKKVRPKRGK